jgi:predicted DNA-binding transcriptional regulator AlpA
MWGTSVHRSSPGRPCRERTHYVLRVETFEDLLRQIIREEVRAALLKLRTDLPELSPSPGEAPSRPDRNPLALTPDDVAKMTGVAVQTLYNWRSETRRGKPVGPRSFKMGHLLRYSEADVNAWLDDLRSK